MKRFRFSRPSNVTTDSLLDICQSYLIIVVLSLMPFIMIPLLSSTERIGKQPKYRQSSAQASHAIVQMKELLSLSRERVLALTTVNTPIIQIAPSSTNAESHALLQDDICRYKVTFDNSSFVSRVAATRFSGVATIDDVVPSHVLKTGKITLTLSGNKPVDSAGDTTYLIVSERPNPAEVWVIKAVTDRRNLLSTGKKRWRLLNWRSGRVTKVNYYRQDQAFAKPYPLDYGYTLLEK